MNDVARGFPGVLGYVGGTFIWLQTPREYLGHLPLFVVHQRMLLKQREDNSNFIAVFCVDFNKYP